MERVRRKPAESERSSDGAADHSGRTALTSPTSTDVSGPALIDAAMVHEVMTATLPSTSGGRIRRSAQARPVRPTTEIGLPADLQNGVERLSGIPMDDVRVHYDSSRPQQVGALAYASGGEIHVAPGQEEHLPHEAWHLVQQAQGRVKATAQLKRGGPVNDDDQLEREADVMGAKAVRTGRSTTPARAATGVLRTATVIQREETREEAQKRLKKANMDKIRKIRDRVKAFRKQWNIEVNAGKNSGVDRGERWTFDTEGGTNNPVKLDRGDSKWKFKLTDVADDLDNSDSGLLKKRYEHQGWKKNILIHVE